MTSDVIAVVQARMGSTRLPGKVLADLDGVPLLRFMLDRLRDLPVKTLVVATSLDPRDDPVAEVAAAADVAVVRGSESDVLDRFMTALDSHPAGTVVRLTADCPLADPSLVDEALRTHRDAGADYTSNTLVRTYPDGLDVEVISATALRTAAAEAKDPTEREHVTPFVYRRPERFALAAFTCDSYLGDERWTVDTPADLEFLRWLVGQLGRRDFGWREAVPFAESRRTPRPDLDLVPAAASTPALRRWTVVHAGASVGEVALGVEAGLGVVTIEVPPDLTDEVELRLRERLTADAQVVHWSVRR